MYERFLVSRGNEHRLFSDLRHTHNGEVIEVGYEDKGIVIVLVGSDVVDSVRAERPLLLEPHLLGSLIEVAAAYPSEVSAVVLVEVRSTALLHGKTSDMDAVYILLIGSIVILPRCIVDSLCRYNIYLILACESLCYEPCVVLRTAVYLKSVALIYQCDPFHFSLSGYIREKSLVFIHDNVPVEVFADVIPAV